ncbi:MAG: hypothetical protein HY273_06015 [Gammaproteobacteria bacterium]|nr:hypothetical protein [Gammaproteobacteria bacterium]
MLKHAAVLFLLLLITACSDGNKVPEPRPEGSIGGRIAAGNFTAGNVGIYAFQDGTRGEKLGGAELASDGRYAVPLRAASQPVLVEIATGRYTEAASGIEVALADGQRLSALVWYESGTTSTSAVTPLTHLATGLAVYKITQGVPVRDAIAAAQQDVSTAFNLDIATTSPLLVSETPTTPALLTDATRYGFFLTALSNLTQWIGAQNGTPPHQIFNSIGLSQVWFDDVRVDGKLDGMGRNQDATAMSLAYGTVALDANLYRMALAQHLLATTLLPINKTGLVFNDLLGSAQSFANSRHALFGGADLLPPLVTAPVIVPITVTPQSTAQRGLLDFKVAIDAIIPANKVAYVLDDTVLGEVQDPAHPNMTIDTAQYAEGAHTLQVHATDALGNQATQEFALYFDNFFVTLASPLITNKAAYAVSGTYGLNGAVLASLAVQNQAAVIDNDTTWHAQLALTPGHNVVTMQLADQLGHTEQYAFTIDLDVTPPSFDTRAGHSTARFSTGGGNYSEGRLSDSNDTQALFIPTDRTELNGIPIRRVELDSNSIPYFALQVSDPITDGVASTAAQLIVRMTYERNGTVIAPSHEIKRVGTEFLIPLTSENLDPDWLKSSPSDKQLLRLVAEDAAGNSQQLELTFRVDFVVTNFALPVLKDIGAELFAATPFDRRADLNNRQFAATEYNLTNTTGKSFNIFLSDTAQHRAQVEIETLVREHHVQTLAATEWQVGQILNALVLNECPSNSSWQNVTSILNYDGTSWVAKSPPAPTPGVEFPTLSDNVPLPPAPSGWTDVPDFDNQFLVREEKLPDDTLAFESDYIVDKNQFSRPAKIRNWKHTNLLDGSVSTCPDVSFFQQRTAYLNASVSGYPKNLLTLRLDQMSFSTTGFTVFDIDAGAAIAATGGWFTIPAGHHIAVRKLVTTPTLTLHNDLDVADPATFLSYVPHYYDKTLAWTVERGALISLAHDAGPANLMSMSAHDVTIGAGKFEYMLRR